MPISASIRSLEVVQAIQNTANDVPLITHKLTFVRVYLEPGDYPSGSMVSGNMMAKTEIGDILTKHPGITPVRMHHHTTLVEQRLDWSKSLNFRLPDEVWDKFDSDLITIGISDLTVIPPDGVPYPVDEIIGTKAAEVTVIKDPDLKCRMVSFRHRDQENMEFVEPSKGEADAVKRFIESAFPVGKVRWSKITAAAPRRFRALSRVDRLSVRTEEQVTRSYMRFFLRLLMMRDQDILAGRDRKTLYFGLISDPSNRFGGAAMDSPQFAAPHVVALAASESEGQVGAHELAHVLGARHPGIPSKKIHGSIIGQREEVISCNINKSGYLSNKSNLDNGENHLGLDSRFNKLTPKILPHDHWFDLMTYRYPSWVSDETYKNLIDRLVEISIDDFEPEFAWTVIGEYDLQRKTARIRYLGPSNYMTPMPDRYSVPEDQRCSSARLKLAWIAEIDPKTGRPVLDKETGKPVLAAEEIYIRDYERLDGSSRFGVFQHTLVMEHTNQNYRCLIPPCGLPGTMGDIFEKSLDRLFKGNGHLSLMFDDEVVDEIADNPDVDQELIDQIITASRISGMEYIDIYDNPFLGFQYSDLVASNVNPEEIQSTTKVPIQLYYSVDDGGYYLDYEWSKEKRADYRVTTAVFCEIKRTHESDRPDELAESNEPKWQIVDVSQRLKNRVWISPVFIGGPTGSEYPKEIKHDIYGDNFVGGSGLGQQKLDVFIFSYVGFKVVGYYKQFNISECQIISCGNRFVDIGHVEYPGSSGESREDRYWYEDTATTCPGKWSGPGR